MNIIKLSKKITIPLLGLICIVSLISIGGCGLDKEPSLKQEEIFDYVLSIIQTVRSEETECGLFKTKDITDGSKYEKPDTDGSGSYKREKKSTTDSKSSIIYDFQNYTGNVKMSDGTVLKIKGTLTGTQPDSSAENMSVSGNLEFYMGETKISDIMFNQIDIDNGTDGAKCGTVESLGAKKSTDSDVAVDSENTANTIVLTSSTNNTNKFELKVANIDSNEQQKKLWEQLIKFNAVKADAPVT